MFRGGYSEEELKAGFGEGSCKGLSEGAGRKHRNGGEIRGFYAHLTVPNKIPFLIHTSPLSLLRKTQVLCLSAHWAVSSRALH